MKKWFFIVFVVFLIVCVYVLIYNGKELYSGLQFMLMESLCYMLDFFVESMIEDLMVLNISVFVCMFIVVILFVDL